MQRVHRETAGGVMRFDCFRRPPTAPDAMTPEPTPARRCDTKRIYETELDALAAMRRLQRKALQPWRLNVYHCEHHQGWHVGNASVGSRLNQLTRES